MASPLKPPLDPTPYPQDPRSRLVTPGLPDGVYVYVQAADGLVYAVPDGPHMHPKVLGGAQSVLYADDVTIEAGAARDLTNLSGTFQCDEPEGLRKAAAQLRSQGISIAVGAVRFFPPDGSRPVVLE